MTFSIFYVLLRKRRQNVQKLNNFNGVYVTQHEQIKFHDLSNYKENITVQFGTFHFILLQETKALLKENFSSLHADAGKIFEITTFTRGPNK